MDQPGFAFIEIGSEFAVFGWQGAHGAVHYPNRLGFLRHCVGRNENKASTFFSRRVFVFVRNSGEKKKKETVRFDDAALKKTMPAGVLSRCSRSAVDGE